METTPAKQQRRPPPAAGGGEPEAKRSRMPSSSGSAGGHRRVVLNPADCDLDFDVGGNGLQGHALHEEGFAYCWSGARATVGITGGKYCFGCRIISEQKVQMDYSALDPRHLCRLGISRGDDPVGSLGESDHSFGFDGIGKFSTAGKFYNYGAEFGVGDTITCAVNLENRPLASIGYSLNGKWLGIAKQFDAGPKGLGVLNSSPSKLSWESALFPHVLLKNVVVQMYFSIEDGLIPEEGYKPWSCALEDGHAIIGPSFPAPKECEVMMMVGLPASWKTRWAEKWVKDHPEKRYVLLGINLALEHMKVPGWLRKQTYGDCFDRRMDRATKILNTLLSRACKIPHNYIIDRKNLCKSTRKQRLQPFVPFRKIAVVVFPTSFPTADELKSQADKWCKPKEMGKEVPAEAVNEKLAHYVLPVSKDMPCADECFDEVKFPDVDRSTAQRYLEQMKCVFRSASNLSVWNDWPPFNTPSSSSFTNKVDSVLDGHLRSLEPLSSPPYSVPGGFGWRNLCSRKDNLQSPMQWSPMTGPKVDSPPPSRRELMALARENCSRGSQDRDRETAPIVSNKLMPPLGSGGCPVVGSTKSPRQTEGKVGEHAAASSSASSSALGSSFPSSPRTAPRSRRQKGRGGFRRCRPTSPFASQTDEEEDTCSTQASTSPPEDQDVSSHESGEAPLHTDSPNVKKTGASSPVEVAAPNPSASLQGSRLLPGKTTAVEGRKSVPSTDFPEHGIHWPDAPQIVPFVGAETVLDTLITSARALFDQQETTPPVEAVQSALRSATRAYHTLGLPKEPWMTALESTWKEFGRAYAASHWKSCRLEIQQLEDEISALSGEARELQSKAGVARGRRSALEAKHAKDTQTVSQLRQAVETLQDRAQKFAAVVETTAKVVRQLQAEESAFMQKDSHLQSEIAARRAQIEELMKKKPLH